MSHKSAKEAHTARLQIQQITQANAERAGREPAVRTWSSKEPAYKGTALCAAERRERGGNNH